MRGAFVSTPYSRSSMKARRLGSVPLSDCGSEIGYKIGAQSPGRHLSGAPRMAHTRPSIADKRRTFQLLHQAGSFAIPNPWDVGSARFRQSLGFKALATTSAGFAWSQGRHDGGMPRDRVLAHLEDMVAATDVPVNADFEGGFARDVEIGAGGAFTVTAASGAGIAIGSGGGIGINAGGPFNLSGSVINLNSGAVGVTGHSTAATAGTVTGIPAAAGKT